MTRPAIAVKIWDGVSFDDYAPTDAFSCTIKGGKEKQLDRIATTTCVLELEDTVGNLDPLTGLQPYGPDTFIVVEATDSGAGDWQIYSGTANTWDVDHIPSGAMVSIAASGPFKLISEVAFPVGYTGPGADTVEALLDLAIAAVFDETPGTWVVYTDHIGGSDGSQVQNIGHGGDMLTGAQLVTRGAGGDWAEWFTDDVDNPTYQFIQRRRRFHPPLYTFTDDPDDFDPANGVFEYDPSSAKWKNSNDLVKNRVTVNRNGGTAQTAEDATSIAARRPREDSFTSYHVNDDQALKCAQNVVAEFADPPTSRLDKIVISPERFDSHADSADLWDFIIKVGLENIGGGTLPLMSRVLVNRTTKFGLVSRECIFIGWEHKIRPKQFGGWVTTLYLADAQASAGAFIIGDATAGLIGTGKLG